VTSGIIKKVELSPKCPICAGEISSGRLFGAESAILCEICGTTLKILCLNPVVLEVCEFNQALEKQINQKIQKSPCCPYCGEKNLRMRKRNTKNIFICLECEIELEVIEVNPIKLILCSEDSWDYDEYEYSY
jgi:ribosomal protein L37AE/L43A